MTRITFVTGVSGAGKSTLWTELWGRQTRVLNDPGLTDDQKVQRADYNAFDIDGEGLPDAGHLDWLRWRGAQLLYEAVTKPGPVGHVVVCGIVWPHAVIDSNAWPEAVAAKADVHWLLLDMPYKVLKERLADRLASKPASERRETLRYNRRLAELLRYQVGNQRNGRILAAHRMTPAEIADHVLGTSADSTK